MQEDDSAVAEVPSLNGTGNWQLFLGLFVLALVGTLSLFGFLLSESRSQAQAKAVTDGTNLAKVLEGQFNTSLRRLDADLQGMAGRLRPQEMAAQNAARYRSEWTTYLNALKVNFAEVKDFYVIDAKGDALYSSGEFRQFNVAERSHFRRLSAEPVASMVWTDVVVSKVDGRPTIVFARGFRGTDGTFLGIVSVTVDLDYFQKVVAAIDLGSQGLVAIRDTQANKLLVRQPPIPAEVNKATKSVNYDRIVQGERLGHSVFTSPLDGKTRYTTFLVLNDFPFFIYVALGEDDVLAAWRSQLRVSSAIAGVLLFLVGLALWWLWRAELARQLGVAALVTTRNQAQEFARKLELSYGEVRHSTEMLEHTGAIAKVGGWSVDLRSMKLSWSKETFRIAEMDTFIEPPLEEGINLFAPEARPTIAAAVQAAMDHGTPYDLELPLITANGHRKWVRTQGFAEMAGGKAVRIFGTFQDITEHMAAQTALREGEAFVRAIIDTVPGLLAYWGVDLVCRFANDSYKSWFGRTSQDMTGISMKELLGEKLFQKNEHYVRAVIAGENQEFERELTMADGDVRQTFAQYIAHWKDGEVVGFLVLVSDISAVKKAEKSLALALKDKDALLKEVHHRVKNNLQVITSLLRLESRRSNLADTKAVLGEMQGRIRAMSLLHESLYRSGTLASVDLGSYLRQLATQAFLMQSTHTGAVQLELDLATVQVGMDQAIPCGLLVNELVSNCLKHGFPDGVTGKVNIALQPLDTAAQWCLRVSDTGVGLPQNFEEKRKSSLGLQLAGDLAHQMGGTLEITPGQGTGVAFAVNFAAIEPTSLVMPV